MALTRVSRHIIDEPFNPTTVSATDVTATNINASGIGTVGTLRVTGDLTVEGTTTTLDSILTEVDRLEVSANSTVAAGIITQTGSGDGLLVLGGNVGIGTDNPAGTLSIYKDSNPYLYFQNSASGTTGNDGFSMVYSGSDMYIANRENGILSYESPGGTERIRVTSSGNVGINDTNPTAKLSVIGNLSVSSDFKILVSLV